MLIPFSLFPFALLISCSLLSIHPIHSGPCSLYTSVIPTTTGFVQRVLSYNSYTSGSGIFHPVLYALASFLNKDN